MPVTERLTDRGRRRGRRVNQVIGEQILQRRRMAGISQAALGAAVGLSKAEVGRIERGAAPWLTVIHAATLLSALGMELSANAFPISSPMRDAGQLRLLEEFEVRLPPSVGRTREWPIPIPGDLRAIDLLLTGLPARIGVEAETMLHDLQALERDMRQKQRDGGLGRMILLLRGSRHNRETLKQADALRRAFPLGTRAILAALARGRDPGGDGIVLL
jgi:transcriptional regulator with XRE-family HTH domain